MMLKHGTLMLRAVLIKLHSIHQSPVLCRRLRFVHSSNYGNISSKNQHWPQRNESFRHVLLMRQPNRLFTSTKYSKKGEAKFRRKDKISEDYDLIYRAPLNSYIYLAQTVALVSSVGFFGVIVYKLLNGSFMVTFPFTLEGKAGDAYGQISSNSTEVYLYTAAFLLFNASIYVIAMRYPLRIYCHKNVDAYACIMNGFAPSLTYKINYCSADVTRSKVLFGNIIPWKNNVFKIGSKTVLLMDNYFRTPADFNLMTSEKNIEFVKLLSVALTIPMTSEAVHCFSTLKIKTFLHNTMPEESLSALAMLFIERDFIMKMIDFNKQVIKITRKEKRTNILYE